MDWGLAEWMHSHQGQTCTERLTCTYFLDPPTSAGDLRKLPRVPLRGEGRYGFGEASRDSTAFVAMEEGLISSGGRNLRLPLRFGLRPHSPSNRLRNFFLFGMTQKSEPVNQNFLTK